MSAVRRLSRRRLRDDHRDRGLRGDAHASPDAQRAAQHAGVTAVSEAVTAGRPHQAAVAGLVAYLGRGGAAACGSRGADDLPGRSAARRPDRDCQRDARRAPHPVGSGRGGSPAWRTAPQRPGRPGRSRSCSPRTPPGRTTCCSRRCSPTTTWTWPRCWRRCTAAPRRLRGQLQPGDSPARGSAGRTVLSAAAGGGDGAGPGRPGGPGVPAGRGGVGRAARGAAGSGGEGDRDAARAARPPAGQTGPPAERPRAQRRQAGGPAGEVPDLDVRDLPPGAAPRGDLRVLPGTSPRDRVSCWSTTTTRSRCGTSSRPGTRASSPGITWRQGRRPGESASVAPPRRLPHPGQRLARPRLAAHPGGDPGPGAAHGDR